MSIFTSVQPGGSPTALVRQHPLVAYFVLAFSGTWLFFAPITLSQRGLGVLPVELPDVAAFLLYFLATYTGPFLAAFWVTRMVEGKDGVQRLWRRLVQWRVGMQWYLVLFLGYPALVLAGVALLDGGLSLNRLLQGWPLLISVYLPGILFGIFFPSLGEETGWRGFALPRLQSVYGPVVGSLILGVLHALWHLPAYPVRGLFADAGWDTTLFIANSLAIVTATIVWTWLFNNARGSIFFAILIHATSNATSALVPQWLGGQGGDLWALAKIFGVTALFLIFFTRGRLGYDRLPQS
ncbi:MAG: CPBP family intramembrane metalloprotease domain-containing protein [Chloroflexi bacterium]|nr:MAG: CPBP family intramembrane metalloprotease domain-containing protein [Chloroflexota bacterium]